MEQAPIPQTKARQVARSGSLADIQAMGRRHLIARAAWEPKSLLLISKRMGLCGIVAAMGAGSSSEAAGNIARMGSSAYLQADFFKLLLAPGMEPLLGEMMRTKPEWNLGYGNQERQAWRIACNDKHTSKQTMQFVIEYFGAPSFKTGDILWAAMRKSPEAWDGLIQAVGLDYFVLEYGAAPNPLGQAFPASTLYTLFQFNSLLPRGRLGFLLDRMEQDEDVMGQVIAQRDVLALGAIRGGRRSLLKRVLKWAGAPLAHLPGNHPHLEIVLAGADGASAPWQRRWSCLKLVGANNRKRVQAALESKCVIDALLTSPHNELKHAYQVLQSAASTGVDLSKVHDGKGRTIVQALKTRQEEMAGETLSMIEHHLLSKQTPGACASRSSRRF